MPIERTIEHWRALPHLSVKEASAVLGVAPGSVRTLLRKNQLEAREFCGKTFVTVPSVRRIVDEEVSDTATQNARPLSAEERRIVQSLKSGVVSR